MLLQSPLPAPGQRVHGGAFYGSSDALGVGEFGLRARALLVVTENAAEAQRLLEEIPFFAPALRVHLFPDWETLRYDHFSPHHDLVSERLATLYQLMRGEFDVALVPVADGLLEALLVLAAPRAALRLVLFLRRAGGAGSRESRFTLRVRPREDMP